MPRTTTTTGLHKGSRHVDSTQEIKKGPHDGLYRRLGLYMFGIMITKNDEERKKKAQTMVYTVVWAQSKFF